jgi:hypothetical protein
MPCRLCASHGSEHLYALARFLSFEGRLNHQQACAALQDTCPPNAHPLTHTRPQLRPTYLQEVVEVLHLVRQVAMRQAHALGVACRDAGRRGSELGKQKELKPHAKQ